MTPSTQQLLTKLLAPVPGMRRGQSFFNELWKEDFVLAERMHGSGIDPYFNDDMLWAAVRYVIAELESR